MDEDEAVHRDQIRAEVDQAFTSRRLWILPPLDVKGDKVPDDYLENGPAYADAIDRIRAEMGKQLKEPKPIAGQRLTGMKIAGIAMQCESAASEPMQSL